MKTKIIICLMAGTLSLSAGEYSKYVKMNYEVMKIEKEIRQENERNNPNGKRIEGLNKKIDKIKEERTALAEKEQKPIQKDIDEIKAQIVKLREQGGKDKDITILEKKQKKLAERLDCIIKAGEGEDPDFFGPPSNAEDYK